MQFVVQECIAALRLSFLQHKVRRLLSSLVLRHRKSKSGQVETGKQCFPLTEYDRRKRKVQGIDQPACRYCRTVETPPPILTSLSPAACFASLSASSIPPVTKWKVVPPSITSGSRS